MLEPFLSYLQWERRRSNATLKAYAADVAQWLNFAEQAMGLTGADGASRVHVRTWVTDLVMGGADARTVNRKLSAIRTYYRWLMSQDLSESNPAQGVPLLRTPSRVVRALTEPEVEALLDPSAFDDDAVGRRDQFLLLTLYAVGLRRSELLGLTYAHVQGNTLRVVGKGNKERQLPLLPEWVAMFERHRSEWQHVSDVIFCTPKGKMLDPRSVYTIVKLYLQRASSSEHLGPHALRHTFATHLLDLGAELTVIRELLGHASLSATQVYTHASVEQLKKVYQRAHPRGR